MLSKCEGDACNNTPFGCISAVYEAMGLKTVFIVLKGFKTELLMACELFLPLL